MPGQPKRRQVVERLESLGGIEWLCEQIADGHSLRDIAADHFDCSCDGARPKQFGGVDQGAGPDQRTSP